jgi:tetratricopeptide (TPR) repeat protein
VKIQALTRDEVQALLKTLRVVPFIFLVLLLSGVSFSDALSKAQSPAAPGRSFSAAIAAAGRAQGDGNYVEAEKQFKAAIEIAKGFPQGDTRITKPLQLLGDLYQSTGQFSDAEQAFRSALEINREVLGPDHYEVAVSLSSLGGLYMWQQRFDEAEPLLKRALEIEEATWEEETTHVSASLSNLGLLYLQQRRWIDAEPLLMRAVAIDEKIRQPNDPQVALSLNYLALVYHAQGQYSEAAPLYARALSILEAPLRDDPNLIQVLGNYAALLRDTGREKEAVRIELQGDNFQEKHLKKAYVEFDKTRLSLLSPGDLFKAYELPKDSKKDILNSEYWEYVGIFSIRQLVVSWVRIREAPANLQAGLDGWISSTKQDPEILDITYDQEHTMVSGLDAIRVTGVIKNIGYETGLEAIYISRNNEVWNVSVFISLESDSARRAATKIVESVRVEN